jgi:inorganic triphosphatase YgiF
MDPHPEPEHTEIESKLVVCTATRKDVVRELHDMVGLGPCSLVEKPPRDVHDLYFDTLDGGLGRHGLSLRLRAVDGHTLLTLKGPTEYLQDGALARLEVEEPWSAAALDHVLGKLRGWGVQVGAVAADPTAAPEPVLESAGLIRIHRRSVRRIVRDAHAGGDGSDRPVAELVLDAVRFEVGKRTILHDEIEVEGRGVHAADHVARLTGALVERFGDGLRPWRPNKLALGRILDALDADGVLERFVDGEGRLSREGYVAVLERFDAD